MSNSVEYQLDEVILTAGESATWSDEEYGLDLDSGDTVKLEFSGANTTGTDRVYLILKKVTALTQLQLATVLYSTVDSRAVMVSIAIHKWPPLARNLGTS